MFILPNEKQFLKKFWGKKCQHIYIVTQFIHHGLSGSCLIFAGSCSSFPAGGQSSWGLSMSFNCARFTILRGGNCPDPQPKQTIWLLTPQVKLKEREDRGGMEWRGEGRTTDLVIERFLPHETPLFGE